MRVVHVYLDLSHLIQICCQALRLAISRKSHVSEVHVYYAGILKWFAGPLCAYIE